MSKPSKQKLEVFTKTLKKLEEPEVDKLLCIAYGMELASAGGPNNDRKSSVKRVASVN